MRAHKHFFCFVIMLTISSCIHGPDPFDPLHEYHVMNVSDDSIVCRYHCTNTSIKNINEIILSSEETKIMYFSNTNDTLSASGLPHYVLKDMLFVNTNGDTILYINPIVDSAWIAYDTTFYHNVYGGKKWIYKFNNK